MRGMRGVLSVALGIAAALILATGTPAAAQEPPSRPGPQASATKPTPVALRVSIVISRHLGEKQTSRLPFVLHGTSDATTAVRVTTTVPVPQPSGSAAVPMYQYNSIGTNLECRADELPDGRFRLTLTISDTGVGAPVAGQGAGPVTLPGFTNTAVLLVRPGQTTQITSAADKTSGEIIRVDVTLEVVK